MKRTYHIAQNVGGGKHWRIWRLSVNSPNFSHPNIINTLKCNGTLTKFAKVFPSKCTDGTISPKFYPANILRYTVYRTKIGFINQILSDFCQAFCICTHSQCMYIKVLDHVLTRVIIYLSLLQYNYLQSQSLM